MIFFASPFLVPLSTFTVLTNSIAFLTRSPAGLAWIPSSSVMVYSNSLIFFSCSFSGFCLLKISYCLSHPEHAGRRNGKLIHAHVQKRLRQRCIRAKLSADPAPDPGSMRIFNRHADQPQHRFMVRVIKALQLLVLPVDRKGILGQIIGSDTEKLHFLRQLVADDSRCGRLHHDSRFHLSEGDPLRRELPFYILHDLTDLPDFLYGDDHGKHDRGRSINGSAPCSGAPARTVRSDNGQIHRNHRQNAGCQVETESPEQRE